MKMFRINPPGDWVQASSAGSLARKQLLRWACEGGVHQERRGAGADERANAGRASGGSVPDCAAARRHRGVSSPSGTAILKESLRSAFIPRKAQENNFAGSSLSKSHR